MSTFREQIQELLQHDLSDDQFQAVEAELCKEEPDNEKLCQKLLDEVLEHRERVAKRKEAKAAVIKEASKSPGTIRAAHTCRRCPGFCCSWFMFFNSELFNMHPKDIINKVASSWPADAAIIRKHFVPNGRRYDNICEDTGRRIPSFHCTAQGIDGKCRIYSRRPELCRLYYCGKFEDGRYAPSRLWTRKHNICKRRRIRANAC